VGSTSAGRGEFSTLGIVLGGLADGLSRPLLDGLMQPDVQPFMPGSDHNPFLGLIEVGNLHLACIAAALAVLGVSGRRRSGENDAEGVPA